MATPRLNTDNPTNIPCRFFAKGICRKGETCKFSHAVPITSVPSSSGNPNSHTQRTRSRRSGPQVDQALSSSAAERTPSGLPMEAAPDTSSNRHAGPSNSLNHRPISSRAPVCRAWKAGACSKGSQCQFRHLASGHNGRDQVERQRNNRQSRFGEREEQQRVLQNARAEQERAREEKLAEEAEARRLAQLAQQEEQRRMLQKIEQERERARQQRLAEEERAREARRAEVQAELQARAAEIAQQNAAKTIKTVTLGSMVTFAAGLEAQQIITGFESCTVKIKNLPLDAQLNEVSDIFTQQGIDPMRFQLVHMKHIQGKQIAEVIMDAETGSAITAGLEDIEFRDERLTFEVGPCNGLAMGAPSRDSNVLTISWRQPSARYIAEFDDIPHAARRVQELNGRHLHGRRVKVEMNTPPPGRALPYFRPNSIKMFNLPLTVTDAEIIDFCGSTLIKRLPGPAYDSESGIRLLREALERIHPFTSFEISPAGPQDTVSVRVKFGSWDEAEQVRQQLEGNRLSYLGNATPWLRLPSPMLYTVTIPEGQYQAQQTLWTSLRETIKDQKACDLLVHRHGPIVHIRVAGSVKPAVGALKVRVEALAAGETVDGWHHSLARDAFARSILNDSGAFLRVDWRQMALKVYGESRAVERARAIITAELDALASAQRTLTLKKQSVGFFIRRGVPELQNAFGEDSVRLNPATRQITIRGGEDAWHTLDRLITESLAGPDILASRSSTQHTCPVCYDDVSSPVQLGCGHVYCLACIRHLLKSALEPNQQFPLVCMGNEARCNVSIAIPTIQDILPPRSFDHLLELAFSAHVAKHPLEFKFCKTPDCNQLYRATGPDSPTVLSCPSCFATVCSSCHEDGHDGMNCEAYRLVKNPEEQERLNEQWILDQGGRIKRCPQCSAQIEKTEGCNHMQCGLCHAHWCWICRGLFPPQNIYEHMNEAHGGMHAVDNEAAAPVPQLEGVNYRQQEELLRQAAIRRAAARQRPAGLMDEGGEEARQRRAEATRRLHQAQVQEQLRQRALDEHQRIVRLQAIREEGLQEQRRWAERRREEERQEAARRQNEGWGCCIM